MKIANIKIEDAIDLLLSKEWSPANFREYLDRVINIEKEESYQTGYYDGNSDIQLERMR